jgi:hypothetical protein
LLGSDRYSLPIYWPQSQLVDPIDRIIQMELRAGNLTAFLIESFAQTARYIREEAAIPDTVYPSDTVNQHYVRRVATDRY